MMNFVNFMRKIEGKEPRPAPVVVGEYVSVYALVRGINCDACRDVLDGEHHCLVDAFTWGSTPQGRDHWSARNDGYVVLSPNDIEFIEGLIDYYEGVPC